MPARLPRAVLWLFVAATAFAALTCVEVPDNAVFACEEGGCPSPLVCKAGFCVNEECKPLTCEGLGKTCGTLNDGCGNELSCGTCTDPDTCNANVCSCLPTPAPAMCADAGFSCGVLSAADACGEDRTVTCGGCGGGAVCNQGSCCTPKTNAQLCAERNLQCGLSTITDECGQTRTLDCGGCDAGTACIAFDTSLVCQPCVPETTPEFCYRNGFECGTAATLKDNCGFTRTAENCGALTCEDGRTCGADGGTRCACASTLMNCSATQQCCSGLVCGRTGLCCNPPGSTCSDDSNCCSGSCSGGFCDPLADAGTQ